MDKYKFTKNLSSLLVAQLVCKIFTFMMTMLMARFLGAEDFGKISFGFSFVWAFLFLADFGFSELFIRDVAQRTDRIEKYINNILSIKIFIGCICFIIIVLLAKSLSFTLEKFLIIVILGASVISDSFMYFFRALFRVRETMEYEGILMVAEAFVKLVIVFFTIKSGINYSSVILISIAFLIVSVINFIIHFIVFKINYKKLFLSFDVKFWVYLLKAAFPFSLIYIFAFLNFRIDIIMLSLLKGDIFAGWFSADYKLLEQFFLFPITLSAVYLPLFSKLWNSVEELHNIFLKAILLLALFAVGIIFLLYFIGAELVTIIFGRQFKVSGNYIVILSLVLLPFFIKPIIEKIFYAFKKQNILCLLYFLCVLSNIYLNAILIPRWGINGASLSTLFCETFLVIVCFIMYFHFLSVYKRKGRLLHIKAYFVKEGLLY